MKYLLAYFKFTGLGLLSILVILYVCKPKPSKATPIAKGWTIPILINILDGANIEKEDAKKIIKEASKILQKEANIQLVPVKTEDHVVVPPDNDGKLTRTERDEVRKEGGIEVASTPNHTGIKIYFAKKAKVETGSPGVSIHRNPTVIIEKRPTDSNQQTSIITAHEIAHVLTIKDHSNDKTNLMCPVEPPGANTNLIKSQVNEIHKEINDYGKCAVQWERAYPAIKLEQQYGFNTDDTGDIAIGTSSYYDIYQTWMSSTYNDEKINAKFSVNGLFPDIDSVNAKYRFLLDTDNDKSTGSIESGFIGIDRGVEISIVKDPVSLKLNAEGSVVDYVSGEVNPLPSDPKIDVGEEIEYSYGEGIPLETQILLNIPKSMLSLTDTEIPVGISSEDMSNIFDTSFLSLDLERWLKDPVLNFDFGTPIANEEFPFTVNGLKPNSFFDLYVNEDFITSGILDDSGHYSGSFLFPNLSLTESHFVTLQDETGEFAFNITCPISEPSTCLLFLSGLFAMVGVKKKFSL